MLIRRPDGSFTLQPTCTHLSDPMQRAAAAGADGPSTSYGSGSGGAASIHDGPLGSARLFYNPAFASSTQASPARAAQSHLDKGKAPVLAGGAPPFFFLFSLFSPYLPLCQLRSGFACSCRKFFPWMQIRADGFKGQAVVSIHFQFMLVSCPSSFHMFGLRRSRVHWWCRCRGAAGGNVCVQQRDG